ncbi:MAG: hypothetical protein GF341_01485 [candidate division Zixibacteria bacterium]|nr:hypothetical protein [candidate division Zixibacteria bacterium]
MIVRVNQLNTKNFGVSPTMPEVPFQGTRSRLRVQVEPLSQRYYGKVFNDLHAETVGYHLVPHQPYHSYIEADGFRLELDRAGRPVYVSVSQWSKGADVRPLSPPTDFDLADLRFLDLRIHCGRPVIEYDPDNALLRIVFRDSSDCHHVALEPHAIWSIDTDRNLCALWLRDIVLDPSGRRFLKWRRRAWSRVRRDFKAGRLAYPQFPTPLSAPEKTSRS